MNSLDPWQTTGSRRKFLLLPIAGSSHLAPVVVSPGGKTIKPIAEVSPGCAAARPEEAPTLQMVWHAIGQPANIHNETNETVFNGYYATDQGNASHKSALKASHLIANFCFRRPRLSQKNAFGKIGGLQFCWSVTGSTRFSLLKSRNSENQTTLVTFLKLCDYFPTKLLLLSVTCKHW